MTPLHKGVLGTLALPALTGTGAPERADAPLFWSSGYYKAVHAGDWKLQVNAKQNKVWLHNLAADPTERTNLALREPARRAQLEALLAEHHRGRRPPLYASSFETPVAIDRTLAEPFDRRGEWIYWPN